MLLSFVILLISVLLVGQISYHKGFTRGAIEWRQIKGLTHVKEQETLSCQAQLSQLQAQWVESRLHSQQLSHTIDQLKLEMKNVVNSNASYAQENILYKKILAPEHQQKGIQINSVQIYPMQSSGKFRYEVLLAKFTHQKQESSGKMKLSVQGVQDDESIQVPLEAMTKDWPEGQPFKVRYFQMLQGQITLPEGFEPESVQVSLVPQNNKEKASSEDFPWLVSIG